MCYYRIMFTGIIEETGKIKSLNTVPDGAEIEVLCSKVLDGTKTGDSICVNGVCQTVTALSHNSFRAKLSSETLAVSTFDRAKAGDTVNLERALQLSSRLGGHIVTGHVDCRGKLLSAEKLSEFYNLEFEIPENQAKYVVRKGSVTVSGISLTVASVSGNTFTTAIIPHTYENTGLKTLHSGDFVNIETDVLAKYVEKILSVNDNRGEISMDFLQENGFLQ